MWQLDFGWVPCSRGGSGAPPLVGGPSIFERDARAAVGLGEGTGPAPGADALILSSASWALTSLPGHLPGREGRISSRSQRASKEELAGGASLASDLYPPPSSLQRYLLGWRRLIRAGRRFLLRCLQVARGSRDDSSPQEPWHLRNMISKSPLPCVRPAGWKLLATLALVLVVMVWYSISREDRYIELFYFPIPGKKEPCLQGEAERIASKLFGNYSREQPVFLQLKDYFWVKTPSAYELPYGTKGSEDLLLRVLAVTSYSVPESIQSLKCRRCVVVGNGHRLRNSSLGEAINKYDVVIRSV
ncbi:CMP-N-acetylneuraminate-beta-galactosamide-alpha-2,3-sialyltransferase 4 isoform X7 [Phocoena sinus]|uniref:CMP-N-acetylneuraminate-beta-galactosamide- alpha-2,3-sialyltransferase 4 isoform X7 n=1 Tax=Phocoena sinus TaxID=42100 RepID=UPI0013C44AF2|nr:CMP-N-acetylneuraminate-beta-galactosamide-alpha-2,3-sialyltransferase 4 isoform X7 [Phocoena sinus]